MSDSDLRSHVNAASTGVRPATDQQLRIIFDSMFQFIGLLDADGILLEANAPALRLVGARRSDVIGKPFWETPWWTHDAEQQDVLKRAVRDAARRQFVRFETNHLGASGERMVLDFSLTPAYDEHGAVAYLIPEGRDITSRRWMEDELRNALAQHQALLASMLDPVVTIDSCGIIHTASDSLERVFGYRPQEIIGCNVNILLPEPHRSAHDRHLANDQQTHATSIVGSTRELVAVRKSGETFPAEVSISRVDLPGRSPELFTGIIHEITERKQSERELQLLQNLTLTISSEPDLNSAFDVALQSICRSTGWDCGEVWHPSDNGLVMEEGASWKRSGRDLQQFREATRRQRFKPGEGLIGRVWQSKQPEWIEDINASPDGMFLRMEAAIASGLQSALAIPILVGEQVVAILSFFMSRPRREDQRQVQLVTAAVAPLGPAIQRRRTEHALHASERRFREVLNDIEVVAIMLDCDGRITFADEFVLQLTGWRREEIIGQSWFDRFLPEEVRGEVWRMFREGMACGELPTQYENEIVTRCGKRLRIAWSNTIMRDLDGRIIGATSIGVDVTKQRRAEEELKQRREQLEETVARRTAELAQTHEQLRMADRLASIGTLAAGLGHDMNNVLLPARCNLDVLESSDLNPESQAQVRLLRRSLDYLQQLTDGLRLFALDPEDDEASGSTTDIKSWHEQIGPLLSRTARNANFCAAIQDGLPPVVVPPHRLTQAVLNLIVNAGEAIGGNGCVRLCARCAEDGQSVRLSVLDNGCGMTKDVRRHALDPFFTTKTRGLGTGLGLSLVRGVAQSAGGSVRILSTPGRGTAVVLLLPTVKQRHANGDQGGQNANRSIASITLDDSRTATFMAAMLQQEGFDVRIDEPTAPPISAIWIVEPRAVNLSLMQEYVHSGCGRLVMFGRPPAECDIIIDAVVIHQPGNFEHIRQAIGDAIALVREVRA